MNTKSEPKPATIPTYHFKGGLTRRTANELAEQLYRLDTDKVIYVGVHLIRPVRQKGGEVSAALPRLWVNICSETGIPFVQTCANRIFAIRQDGTLGEAEVVR